MTARISLAKQVTRVDTEGATSRKWSKPILLRTCAAYDDVCKLAAQHRRIGSEDGAAFRARER
jgi:hypothetical protein